MVGREIDGRHGFSEIFYILILLLFFTLGSTALSLEIDVLLVWGFVLILPTDGLLWVVFEAGKAIDFSDFSMELGSGDMLLVDDYFCLFV
jgi:hypothetical protein